MMTLAKKSTLVALAVTALFTLFASPSHAHFILQNPPAYSEQDSLGSPQKSGPCGQADPGYDVTPTGMTTQLQPGGKFTLTIQETVPHPGHYRVAIAADQASLPADPMVTAGSTACGSTTIVSNPTLPILADGLFQHTSAFSAPQSAELTLPSSLPCTNCTLQVIEFMSQHGLNTPGGCFYHHCANITIPPVDMMPPEMSGCQMTGQMTGAHAPASLPAAGLLGLGLLLLRRRALRLMLPSAGRTA